MDEDAVGRFWSRTVRDETDMIRAEGDDGEFTPEQRAQANASKEQLRSEAIDAIRGATTFIVTAASPEPLEELTAEEQEKFAFSVTICGSLDGEMIEIGETLYANFEHIIERFASTTDHPPLLVLAALTSRWMAENRPQQPDPT